MTITLLSLVGVRGGSLSVTIKVKVSRALCPRPDFDTGKSNLLSDNALVSLVFLFEHLVFIHILFKLEVFRHHRGNGIVKFVIDNVGRMMHS